MRGLGALCLSLLFLLAAARSEPIGAVQMRAIDGVRVRTLVVDVTDPHVRLGVELARGFPHAGEPFEAMIARSQPIVAIDGAYFSKADLAPIGDIVVHGKLVYAGLMGTALAVTRTNEITMKRVTPDRAQDWSRYETVLACGPALVLGGRIDVDPVRERFRDPHVMRAARRMGIAVLRGGRLEIVETVDAVTFGQLARVMYDAGALEAMNLDAGASLAFYVRGRMLSAPGRPLTNIFTIRLAR